MENLVGTLRCASVKDGCDLRQRDSVVNDGDGSHVAVRQHETSGRLVAQGLTAPWPLLLGERPRGQVARALPPLAPRGAGILLLLRVALR
jgi:hypothetical protein